MTSIDLVVCFFSLLLRMYVFIYVHEYTGGTSDKEFAC